MFRRVGVWLIMVAVTVMAGCRSTPKAQPSTVDFSCQIRADYRDLTVEALLTRHQVGTLILEFTQPATLDGLKAVWDGDKVTMQLYGLSYSADPDNFPEGGLGQELIEVLDAALRGEGKQVAGEGNTVVVTGETAAGVYTMTCDGNSGFPLSVTMPSVPLSVMFVYS